MDFLLVSGLDFWSTINYFWAFLFWSTSVILLSVFKFGEKDIHKLQIGCDVTDQIGDVIEKFHVKHGTKYSKVIFDGDVIPTSDYKKTRDTNQTVFISPKMPQNGCDRHRPFAWI